MKVGLNENGNVFIDGEYNTVVYGDIVFENMTNLQINNMIIFKGRNVPDTKKFGSNIKIKNKVYKYIGIQEEREVYWDETEEKLIFGKTQKEIQDLFELHKDIDPYGEEEW